MRHWRGLVLGLALALLVASPVLAQEEGAEKLANSAKDKPAADAKPADVAAALKTAAGSSRMTIKAVRWKAFVEKDRRGVSAWELFWLDTNGRALRLAPPGPGGLGMDLTAEQAVKIIDLAAKAGLLEGEKARHEHYREAAPGTFCLSMNQYECTLTRAQLIALVKQIQGVMDDQTRRNLADVLAPLEAEEAAIGRPLVRGPYETEDLIWEGGNVVIATLLELGQPEMGHTGASYYKSKWKVEQTIRGTYGREEAFDFNFQTLPAESADTLPMVGRTYLLIMHTKPTSQICTIFENKPATLQMLRKLGLEDAKPAGAAPLPGSDQVMLVVSFYSVLLQEEEPTLQQEKELFGLSSPLRINLLASGKGAESDPVLLQLFRQHRELFLPLGEMGHDKYLGAIQITSPFKFVRSLKRIKNVPEDSAYVMAMFVREAKAKPPHFYTVVFPIMGGRIIADGIEVGGSRGQLTYEKFFDMGPVKKFFEMGPEQE